MSKESFFSDEEKEAIKFLERDFNQCFLQARHYDTQILDSFKFLFTIYLGLVGFSLSIYQVGIKEHIDLSMPGAISSLLGIIIGLFMLMVVTRNRAYFVQTMRYINEQRQLFLKYNPLGFKNISKMYTNPQYPDFFNWSSSQAWLSHIVAFMNSIILSITIFLLVGVDSQLKWCGIIIVPLLFLGVQLFLVRRYLIMRETKFFSKHAQ